MMFDVKTPAGLAAFDEALHTQAFATGFVHSGEDSTLFGAIESAPCAKTYPNVARWYRNIASYDKSER
ncbi:hypothetical protein TELCIR_14531, partial [Teladorsagia circumcincta]